MNDDFNKHSECELTADEQALVNEMPALADVGQTRRAFLEETITGVTRAIEVTATGKVINPKALHSQEIGGVVWGIGMALQEATEIDHRYGRIMNPNLQHYHVPVNADVHEVETMFVEEDDTVVNALGVKGMGELGMVGIPAAIANAVFHATGRRIRELPITLDKLL